MALTAASDLKGVAALLAAVTGLVTAIGAFRNSNEAKSKSDSATTRSETASTDVTRSYDFLAHQMQDVQDRLGTLERSPSTAKAEARVHPSRTPISLKNLPRTWPALEDDTDRTGGDYNSFDILDAPGPNKCRQACIDDPKCRAFTYARPATTRGPSSPARCFLKSQVMAPVQKPCCVSGVVDRNGKS